MRKFGFENEEGTSFNYGIRFLSFPVFEYGKEIVHEKSVGGKKGTLTVRTGMYTDTVIKNELEFKCADVYEYEKKRRAIRQWLMSTQRVTYSDSEDSYYEVKNVEITGEERVYGVYGIFTVVFKCSPSLYLKEGDEEQILVNGHNIVFNPYAISQPTFHVVGNGVCKLSVNGKVLTVNVSGSVTIDTDLMITYMGSAIKNTAISGRYADAQLIPGENTIIVENGFNVTLVPRWRMLL